MSSLLRARGLSLVHQVTAHTSKEMEYTLAAHRFQVDKEPIETPCAIGTVERYHAPLRLAFERIRANFERQISHQECMNMKVFSINCTVCSEGLCPAFLVFGAVPLPARMILAPTQLERARRIELPMKEIEEKQARRIMAFGLRRKGNMKRMKSLESL